MGFFGSFLVGVKTIAIEVEEFICYYVFVKKEKMAHYWFGKGDQSLPTDN